MTSTVNSLLTKLQQERLKAAIATKGNSLNGDESSLVKQMQAYRQACDKDRSKKTLGPIDPRELKSKKKKKKKKKSQTAKKKHRHSSSSSSSSSSDSSLSSSSDDSDTDTSLSSRSRSKRRQRQAKRNREGSPSSAPSRRKSKTSVRASLSPYSTSPAVHSSPSPSRRHERTDRRSDSRSASRNKHAIKTGEREREGPPDRSPSAQRVSSAARALSTTPSRPPRASPGRPSASPSPSAVSKTRGRDGERAGDGSSDRTRPSPHRSHGGSLNGVGPSRNKASNSAEGEWQGEEDAPRGVFRPIAVPPPSLGSRPRDSRRNSTGTSPAALCDPTGDKLPAHANTAAPAPTDCGVSSDAEASSMGVGSEQGLPQPSFLEMQLRKRALTTLRRRLEDKPGDTAPPAAISASPPLSSASSVDLQPHGGEDASASPSAAAHTDGPIDTATRRTSPATHHPGSASTSVRTSASETALPTHAENSNGIDDLASKTWDPSVLCSDGVPSECVNPAAQSTVPLEQDTLIESSQCESKSKDDKANGSADRDGLVTKTMAVSRRGQVLQVSYSVHIPDRPRQGVKLNRDRQI